MAKTYTCYICGKTGFKNARSLATHRYKYHNDEKEREVTSQTDPVDEGPLNLRIYPKADVADEIVNNHLDKNRYKYDDETWNRLKRKANSDQEPPPKGKEKKPKVSNVINCRLCSAKFANDVAHATHVAEQHPSCIDCRKQFKTRKEYEKHQHPLCTVCKRTFTTEKQLGDHLKTHPKCQQCGEVFVNQAQLNMHWDRHHRRPSPDSSDSELSWDPPKRPKLAVSDSETVSSGSSASVMNVVPETPESYSPSEGSLSPTQSYAPSEGSVISQATTLSAPRDVVPYAPSEDSLISPTQSYAPSEGSLISQATTVSTPRDVVTYDPDDDFWEFSDSDAVSFINPDELPDPPSSQMRKCPICFRKFASQWLAEHIKEDHESGGRKRDPESGSDKVSKKKKPNKTPVFVCGICSKSFASQKLLDHHIDSEHGEVAGPSNRQHKYDCTICAARFETVSARDIHLSMEHPKCRICNIRFPTMDEYLRHNLRMHPTDRSYDEGTLPSESEDEASDEDDPRSLNRVEERQFRKHVDCVTAEKFLEIRELIDHNQFDTLVNDQELLEALQVIFKGLIKGYIPLCSPQRLILTRPMKKLIFSFGTNPSSRLLMRNKKHLKQIFQIIRSSVDLVVESLMKYGE